MPLVTQCNREQELEMMAVLGEHAAKPNQRVKLQVARNEKKKKKKKKKKKIGLISKKQIIQSSTDQYLDAVTNNMRILVRTKFSLPCKLKNRYS